MRDDFQKELKTYTAKGRLRRIWRKSVQVMACVVVFCTTYALILPAITQESNVYCGHVAHTHSDECYSMSTAEPSRMLACPVTGDVAHTHGDYCTDENGLLVCTLPELEQHIHTEECVLVTEETHETSEPDEASESDETSEPAATEPVIICTDPLAEVHVHTEDCILVAEQEPELVCGMEEHTHTLSCHSDAQADLETEAVWVQSFAGAELTGDWHSDVLAIANTQLGYAESNRNYLVCEDGVSIRGYTRYGAWYGDPYGDWCAMFVSFCMHYAGVDMPLESSVPRWIATLSEGEWALYRSSDHVPQPGEVIFLDINGNGEPDHVGLVEAISDEEGGIPVITTIEGNSVNRVQNRTYSADDAAIVGYASLPVQLTDAEQLEVDMVAARIDALPAADEIGEEDEASTQKVAEAYYHYSLLEDYQQKKVPNADKLLELEPVWSTAEYVAPGMASSAPVTVVESANTGDLVELNIFDYYGVYSAADAGKTDINDRFDRVSREFPEFRWNGGAYPYRYYDAEEGWIADRYLPECLDFGNSLITDYRLEGTLYEPDRAVVWEDGYRGEQSAGARPGDPEADAPVLSGKLGDDGYPYLVGTDAEDPGLDYLFDEENPDRFADKLNSENADGLFRYDPVSGEYFYNSRWNHAWYNAAESAFELYDQTLTPNFLLYPYGNFLPMQDITVAHEVTQVQAINRQGGMAEYVRMMLEQLKLRDSAAQEGDLSVKQLMQMLESYEASWTASGNWEELTAADALNDFFGGEADWTAQPELIALLEELYNINYDAEKNFFFGMDMKMTFLQPENGLTGGDNGDNAAGIWEWSHDKNGDTLTDADDTLKLAGAPDGISDYPAMFSYEGDADVWVYVDGIRFLDLSGDRSLPGGRIDFRTGKVCYGSPESDGYTEQSFRDILTGFGGIPEESLGEYLKQDAEGNYTTFHDHSAHTISLFYLEREAGSSLCDIRFNLPLVRENSITVSCENTAEGTALLGDPDSYFNIVNSNGELFVGPGSVTGITQYLILDRDGNVLKNEDGTEKVFTTDAYGIFTLKAGQTARFEGILGNRGDFFVQELIPAEDLNQYSAVYINDLPARNDDLIDWSGRDYACPGEQDSPVYEGPYGLRWYGRSSEIKDGSATAAFAFRQQKLVDTAKLGSLAVTQELIGSETDSTFRVEVLLDGAGIPVGTVYTVGDTALTVTEEGILTLNGGQTAIIHNILSGTRFAVRGLDGEGYALTYTCSAGADSGRIAQNDGITGVIRAENRTAVTVTNAEEGASVLIPVSVALANPDGQPYTYTILLEQVTDNTGTTPVENGTVLEQEVTVTEEPVSFGFSIPYVKSQMTELPMTFWYRITEKDQDTSNQTVAEVAVEETEEGIRATLTVLSGSNGQGTAEFINTLTGSLTVHNVLNGDAEHMARTVSLEITLTPPENMTLPEQIRAVHTAADGTETVLTLIPEDGRIRIEALAHGETLAIPELPAGTQWSVYQDYANGFITTTLVGEERTEGRYAYGALTTGETAVTYTNTQTYVLPETGGTGTYPYTMAGWMLLLCTAAYLLYKYDRCKRGNSKST